MPKTIDPAFALDGLETVTVCQGDSEIAHSAEDRLYLDILQAIADGTCVDPAECARIAVKTQDLDFPRHTA